MFHDVRLKEKAETFKSVWNNKPEIDTFLSDTKMAMLHIFEFQILCTALLTYATI